MKAKKQIVAALFLSGSVGVGAQTLFAQGTPGPGVPEPGTEMPPQTQPTIPPQPAPGVPQTQPLPGQPGTIPERIQPPEADTQQEMVISSEEIKRAQEALKAQGHDPGAVSGRMHAKTQEALREFQKANNLTPTGVLDKKTADKLGVTVPDQTGSMPRAGH
jgi:hypothetical protein